MIEKKREENSLPFFVKFQWCLAKRFVYSDVSFVYYKPLSITTMKNVFTFPGRVSAVFLCFFICLPAFNQQVLKWAKKTGGISEDYGTAVALDAQNNMYATGRFSGTVDFNPNVGQFNLTAVNFDPYITKYDKDGNWLWAKALTGTNSGWGYGIACDATSNVISCGNFNGTLDLDPGQGTVNVTASGMDAYLLKLDASGNYTWGFTVGGSGEENFSSVTTDASGHIYVCGWFENTVDFDPGNGTTNLVSSGNKDIVVARYNASGALQWARRIGGSGADQANSLALDGAGNVLVTGSFSGTVDFNPGVGTNNLTSAGAEDIFVLKLNSSGDYVWANRAGSTTADKGISIHADASNNVIFGGTYTGTVDFNPGGGVANLTESGSADIFIAKWTSAGAYTWARSIGGNSVDLLGSIDVDASGAVYYTGYFRGTADLDPGNGTFSVTASGIQDIMLSKLTSAGNFAWALHLGGADLDGGYGLALDPYASIYTTGVFRSTVDFDPGVGTVNLNSSGAYDAYYARYQQCSPSAQNIPVSLCQGDSIFAAGAWRKTAGNYTDSTISQFGCDSLVTRQVTIRPSYQITLNPQVCTGQSYTMPDGSTQSSTGVYQFGFTSVYGCDSNYTVNLSVVNNYTVNASQPLCQGDSIQFGNAWISNSGTYNHQFTTSGGCDSNVTLNVFSVPQYAQTVSAVFCEGNTYTLPNGQTVNFPGIYNVTVPTVHGCDSAFAITLNVLATPDVVIQPQNQNLPAGNNVNFTVNVTGGNIAYQWKRNGISLVNGGNISGANAAMLTVSNISAADAGSYHCYVSNTCGEDSSQVVTLNVIVGLEEENTVNYTVFPNPASDMVYIRTEGVNLLEYAITDATGKQVLQGITAPNAGIRVAELPAGWYILRVGSDGVFCHTQLLITR